jgi:hypothetical protein
MVTAAHLLTTILDARADAYFAADYMSEFVTSSVASAIIRLNFRDLLQKREKSAAQVELFQDTYLKSARAVRDAINTGQSTFDEFLKILEKAARFKDWLRTRNPDEPLLREYYKAVTADTWVDALPSKALRFAIATGAGIAFDVAFPSGIGTMAGIGLGAFDNFVLDRILKGWRPNQFIEGPLTKFIGTS